MYIAVLEEQNLIKIDPDKVKLTCLISKDLMKRVKQYALDNDTNITQIVINALENQIKK